MHKSFLVTWSIFEVTAYNSNNVERKPTSLGSGHIESKPNKTIKVLVVFQLSTLRITYFEKIRKLTQSMCCSSV
jgi:hypothetical protein